MTTMNEKKCRNSAFTFSQPRCAEKNLTKTLNSMSSFLVEVVIDFGEKLTRTFELSKSLKNTTNQLLFVVQSVRALVARTQT